jgi:hypothetical protein
MQKSKDLTAADLPGVEPSPLPNSLPGRLFGIFYSPGDTFGEIVQHPNFLAPLLLTVLASIAVTETILKVIGVERILLTQLARSSRAATMTPEQLEQVVRQSAGVTKMMMHGSFIMVPLVIAIVAAIGLAVVNLIHGRDISFRTAFSVTCYANLVNVLGLLMALPVIIWGEPEQFNPQSFIPSNLGFFLTPTGNSKFLMSLAGSVDLLTIWYVILLGIGFSASTDRKVGATGISLYLFGLWGGWIVIKGGLAALT